MNRSDLLRFSLGLLGSLLLGTGAVLAREAAPRYPGKEALEKLLEGNRHYVGEEKLAEVRKTLVKGQSPFAVIVGCADSRVGPEIIFDQGLGDLFVVRCAGNVVDASLLGSIEYAVEHLGARCILVVGHEDCGAVKAALESSEATPNLQTVIGKIKATLPPGEKNLSKAVEANARGVAREIRQSQPGLSVLAHGEEVVIRAAVYDLDSGKVRILED